MGALVPGDFALASWLFVRLYGLVCVVAFTSLLVQLRPLFGARGLAPIAETVSDLERRGVGFARVPSVLRWRSDDGAILATAWIGLLAAVLVTLDVATVAALAVVWVSYLSFTTVGRGFLAYQWDVLLLEVAVVALLLSLTPTSGTVLLLAWFLAVRVMLSSGLAKLASGDRTWRDLTALTYHHETQPLPTRFAWHLHHLPEGTHRATTLAVLVIEVGGAVLLLGPEPVRLAAVVALVVLQVGIAVSGNYGFFNLLAVALLVPLVPDRLWRSLLGDDVMRLEPPIGYVVPDPHPALFWGVAAAAAVVLALNLARLVAQFTSVPRLERGLRRLAPWRIVNRYGLFAVMTTTRPELVVEGSTDGETWHPYRFRWKPGDPARPPRWNAPHQPRLDWQLWFAALGDARRSPWFLRFVTRLLEGSDEVTRLVAESPFDERPPRYVRVLRRRYTFTDRATRRGTGRWWDVGAGDLYLPPSHLDADGRLRTRQRW